MSKESCAHAACSCRHDAAQMIHRNGRAYCSQHCADHTGEVGTCGCGHDDCKGS